MVADFGPAHSELLGNICIRTWILALALIKVCTGDVYGVLGSSFRGLSGLVSKRLLERFVVVAAAGLPDNILKFNGNASRKNGALNVTIGEQPYYACGRKTRRF